MKGSFINCGRGMIVALDGIPCWAFGAILAFD
jgi:hypothetical protein